MKIEYTHGIGLRISIGFFMAVLLMVALTFVGLKHMTEVNFQIKNIVENNIVKTELGHIMQDALHERALGMHTIAVLKDEFLQDDEFMHFSVMGVKYLDARKKLENLELTSNEKTILAKIRVLTRDAQPYVQEVIELGMELDKNSIAFDETRVLAISKQRLIAKQVQELVSFQEEQAKVALNKEQESYIHARTLMLLLAALAIALAILIAMSVIRHVTRQADLLEHQALHDELTGLANRLLFQDRLKKSILSGQRQATSFSLILIDLDQFKAVNDSLGHNVGDLLLQEIARRLKNNVRKMDTVARLGGDEFVIILDSIGNEQVIKFAEKLVKVIAKPFLLARNEIKIGISMGISSYPEHGHDSITLVNRADMAMYEAKRKNIPYTLYSDNIKK